MSRARDLADGTFTGEVTVNDTVRLDTGDTTVSTDDVFGDIEFYDNDGGSAGAGVTAKIQSTAASTYGASQLIFSTSSSSGGARTALTERLRIQSGGGISFNGDTAAANALDDYEEGTWTPTVLQGSINTYSNAFYTKIGNTVHLHVGGIRLSDTTTTSAIKIYGHPFATNNRSMGSMMIRYAGTTEGYAVYFAGDYIEFFRTTNTASWVQLKHSDLTSTSCDLYLSVTYQTAA